MSHMLGDLVHIRFQVVHVALEHLLESLRFDISERDLAQFGHLVRIEGSRLHAVEAQVLMLACEFQGLLRTLLDVGRGHLHSPNNVLILRWAWSWSLGFISVSIADVGGSQRRTGQHRDVLVPVELDATNCMRSVHLLVLQLRTELVAAQVLRVHMVMRWQVVVELRKQSSSLSPRLRRGTLVAADVGDPTFSLLLLLNLLILKLPR